MCGLSFFLLRFREEPVRTWLFLHGFIEITHFAFIEKLCPPSRFHDSHRLAWLWWWSKSTEISGTNVFDNGFFWPNEQSFHRCHTIWTDTECSLVKETGGALCSEKDGRWKRGREDQNALAPLKITYETEVFAQENVGFGCSLVVGSVHCQQFLLQGLQIEGWNGNIQAFPWTPRAGLQRKDVHTRTHAHTHTYAHVCNRPGGEGRRAAFPEWEMRTYIDQKMESSTEARERCERGIWVLHFW